MSDVPVNGGPDISVVLATYDRRHSLPRAIASVLAQDGVRFEEVSVGYPREWKLRVPPVPAGPRQILPAPEKIVTRPGGFRW